MEWMLVTLGMIGTAGLVGLIFLLYIKSRSHTLHAWFFPFLLIKLAAGIFLGFIYFFYYETGDTTAYHQDATYASGLALEDFKQYLQLLFSRADDESSSQMLYYSDPRALLMSKTLSVIYLLSFRSYWIASLFFSFFSFAGAWFLADFLSKKFFSKATVAVSFFLFPSVVFWTSGILKESLMMGSICFLIWIFLRFLDEKKLWGGNAIIFLAFVGILWLFKYYYAAILLPILISIAIAKHVLPQKIIINHKLLVTLIFLLLVVKITFLASMLHPNLRISRVLHVLVENYETMRSQSPPEKTIEFQNLTPDVRGIARNLPSAIVAGLYRPFIWESNSVFAFVVGVENIFLLMMSLLSFYLYVKNKGTKQYLLVTGALLFILAMASLLSISSPNFGTLARFRTGFMPFLLLLLLEPINRLVNSR